MKLALDIKNTSRAVKPIKDDVIIYDGNSWYITTKENILKEDREMLENFKKENEKKNEEMKKLKKDVANQLYKMSELIKKLYSK